MQLTQRKNTPLTSIAMSALVIASLVFGFLSFSQNKVQAEDNSYSLVTNFSPTNLRNNYTGWVGMKFQVGNAPLTVNSLGRMVASGNTDSHTVKLLQANGTDLPDASVAVDTSQGTAGQFKYTNLTSSVTLSPNTSYYIVSQETAWSDSWYDISPISVTSAATVVGPAYFDGVNYFTFDQPGASYAPVSLTYDDSTPAPASIVISNCTEITSPGNYILNGDITDSASYGDSNCIRIHDVTNVKLDCQNHNISDVNGVGAYNVSINNVTNSSVSNCTFKTQADAVNQASGIAVANSNNTAFTNNTFGEVSASYTNHLTFTRNTIIGSFLQETGISNILDSNTITANPNVTVAAAVSTKNGANNTFTNNTINGSLDPARYNYANSTGADDGIVVFDESNNTYSANNISNVWDCGIETAGTITNSRFSYNTINTAALCGIGGWYWSSWKDNTVDNNTVNNALSMFQFYHSGGMRANDTKIYFVNNTFQNNTFTNPRNFAYPADMAVTDPSSRFRFDYFSTTLIPGDSRLATASDLVMGTNSLIANNFGTTSPAPEIINHPSQTTQFITDGGGNICGTIPSYATDYPIYCNAQ